MRTLVGALLLVACGGGDAVPDAASGDDASIDAAPMHVDDGAPMRRACTSTFGSAVTGTYGRLDGYLVAIVQPGTTSCGGDNDHLHLQVLVNTAVYDVAVNVGSSAMADVHSLTMDLSLRPWVEGWHPGGAEDYPTLGVHSTQLPLETSVGALASEITADLATANHISIFAIGYGPTGVHDVHRNGFSHDGLIVTEPLSTPSHARLFSFTSQTF